MWPYRCTSNAWRHQLELATAPRSQYNSFTMASSSSSTGKRKRKQTSRSSNANINLDHHTNPEMSFGTGNAVLFTQAAHEASSSFTITAHEADLNRVPAARSLEVGGKGLIRLEQDDFRMRVKGQGKHANAMVRETGSTIVDADVGFVDERPNCESEGESWVDRYVYFCTRLKEMPLSPLFCLPDMRIFESSAITTFLPLTM